MVQLLKPAAGVDPIAEGIGNYLMGIPQGGDAHSFNYSLLGVGGRLGER